MDYFIIILVSVILSAFFSGMEIAFLSSNKLKLEIDKKQNWLASKILSIFTNKPGQYISTILVGNNIALVVYGIVMAKMLEPYLLNYISTDAGLLLTQTIISTIIILVLAEFLPKALFRLNPNFALNIFYLPLFLFYLLFYPVTKFTIGILNFILKKIFNIKTFGVKQQYAFGKVDLGNLINIGGGYKQENVEYDSEIKYFQNVLGFSSVKVRDCMIPRNEIVCVEMNSPIDELKEKFIKSGYSKVLVYKSNIDNIIGYVSSKELFKSPKSIKSIILRCLIIPETMAANKLLDLFMRENKNIAVVLDEFGGTSGLVTMEDVIEEIFGEIEDEHDVLEFVDKQVSDEDFILSGRLEIDYLNEKYSFDIPENEEYDTLAGFILFHHQSLPDKGEEITIRKFHFKVLKVSGTRLELVNVKIME